MPNKVTIVVRRSGEGYVARIKEDGTKAEFPYGGNSPDEAIGYLMREEWLGGRFAGAVYIDFDIQSDKPA